MSLIDLGKNDISEEAQALKDRHASRDTECAALRTQLMRREAELEELRATFNDTFYKLGKEAERALQLEQEVSTRSSELKTERISLRNTELALQSAQGKLKAEERAKRELESTLDTVSLHSQTTNAEHQAVQREKRALESRVRELERIVQTHEARRVSNIPHKSGRPRSSSVSNFRLPAVEQELNDTKAQLHAKETSLRVLEQKLSQVQEDLVKAENARISADKTGQKRVSELLSTLEKREEDLEALREADNTGEREEELLKRIDEDAAKIAALEKLVTESQTTHSSQAKIQKLQSQLNAGSKKLQRSEDLQSRLLHEKEELVRQYEASRRELVARECQVTELETKHAHLLSELDAHSCCKEPLSLDAEHSLFQFQQPNGMPAFPNESALADHIQTLLQAIDRLRNERDELKRALEFSEVEYRITTEGFHTRIASLTRQLAEGTHAISADKPPVHAHVQQKMNQLTSCATAFSVVISNLQTHLDASEDRLSATVADLISSNSQLHDALAVVDSQKQSLDTNAHEHDALLRRLDTAAEELSESKEECDRLHLQLTVVEEQVVTMGECAKASEAAREEEHQNFLSAEEHLAILSKNCQDMESDRNSLALQITNLQDDLTRVQDELTDAQNRYNILHAQQLSAMSASEVVQALKERIQELEARIAHYTDQIGDYQHDIRQLEANVKLHEERIGEMASELELLTSQKEAMVEDCAEAREARDDALERLEVAEEEAEALQQAMHARDAELSATSLMVENRTSESQQAIARLEAANAGLTHELDALRCGYQRLDEQLNAAVSRSRSLELEISEENAQVQQAIVSSAVIHHACKDSTRQLQRCRQHAIFLESQLATLRQDLEQKVALVDSGEKEKHELLQRLSDISNTTDRTQDRPQTIVDLHAELDSLQSALQGRERELATTRQALEETKCRCSKVEADLLERIATMTMDLRAQAGQAEDIANLRVEADNARAQLQNSLQNFADLEKLHDDVIQEFIAAKEGFERQFAETDEQIRTLDVDHQQILSAMETRHRHDTNSLTSHLEDREHEMDELRQELQDMLEAHARTEGKFRAELKSYEVQHAHASDLEGDLRQTIADMRQELTRAEAETVALQEGRQSLQTEITSLQAEVQRSTSLTRYLESQVRESEDACVLLKESAQRLQSSLAESEKAGKVAEFNLTLQGAQHEKVVTALRREIASLQSGPELRSALADLEEKNREMDDLLRAKCQEIEEYDDRILETLKANKKLTNRVESLTRKVQVLQTKLSSVKNQPQEPVAESTPPKKVSSTPGPSPPVPPAPAPISAHTGGHPNSIYIRESAAPSLPLRSKTPEPQPQSVAAQLPSRTPRQTSEVSRCETSAGKKRPAPDDDERDGVPAEGHYSTDTCIRNGPTPRLRRAHGQPAGFTPVRGASSRRHVALSSPGRRVAVTPSEVITDVTNSPRAPSRQGDSQLKKKSWLGKIRGGAGSQPASSRLGAFGGQ